MKTSRYKIKLCDKKVPLTFLLALLLVGCASTPPRVKFVKELAKEQRVDSNDITTVNVQASDGVDIAPYDKERLTQRILFAINTLKLRTPGSADKQEYEIEVRLTRYDEGNAFARIMLAGLGQIHITATVAMFTLPSRDQVAEFKINKTFAWGGIYGGGTSIEDVEKGFAKGVAKAVVNGQ